MIDTLKANLPECVELTQQDDPEGILISGKLELFYFFPKNILETKDTQLLAKTVGDNLLKNMRHTLAVMSLDYHGIRRSLDSQMTSILKPYEECVL